jgi:hypothetical protein
MLKPLIQTIARAYDAARHRDLLAALWEEERWFSSHRQWSAAQMVCKALADARLAGARILAFRADGRTRYQDWTTHLAWDCHGASLRAGDESLVRPSMPTGVVQWSGPLAETSAPVVDGDAPAPVGHRQVRGKFVLTARPPLEMKQQVKGAAPAGIISDYLGDGVGYGHDTVRWCNTWGDGPDGWYFRASDVMMPGFCLSPQRGAFLRRRLSADPSLRVTGTCESRLYEGEGSCVTAVLPGLDAFRDVWLFGHSSEQGANDNCSGVSVLVEAVRMLADLVSRGLLPRPRLSIRVVTSEECIGMLAFLTEHGSLRRRALVGLNLDSVGDASGPDRPFRLFFGPLSAPTFGWAVAGIIGEGLMEQNRGAYFLVPQCQPPTGDDMIADPNCGIPSLWLGRGRDSVGYHSSRDTPQVCDAVSLRASALLAAAWAYVMASLDSAPARLLVPAAVRWTDGHVIPSQGADARALRRWTAAGMLRDLHRWGVPESVYEAEAARYWLAGAPPLPDLSGEGPRFRRRTYGTCTLETLPPERTQGLSRWSLWQAAALYWTDGRRPMADIERLVRAEVGRVPDGGLAHLMEACVEARVAERTA